MPRYYDLIGAAFAVFGFIAALLLGFKCFLKVKTARKLRTQDESDEMRRLVAALAGGSGQKVIEP